MRIQKKKERKFAKGPRQTEKEKELSRVFFDMSFYSWFFSDIVQAVADEIKRQKKKEDLDKVS